MEDSDILRKFAHILRGFSPGENRISEIFEILLLSNHSGLDTELIYIFNLIGSVTIKIFKTALQRPFKDFLVLCFK